MEADISKYISFCIVTLKLQYSSLKVFLTTLWTIAYFKKFWKAKLHEWKRILVRWTIKILPFNKRNQCGHVYRNLEKISCSKRYWYNKIQNNFNQYSSDLNINLWTSNRKQKKYLQRYLSRRVLLSKKRKVEEPKASEKSLQKFPTKKLYVKQSWKKKVGRNVV